MSDIKINSQTQHPSIPEQTPAYANKASAPARPVPVVNVDPQNTGRRPAQSIPPKHFYTTSQHSTGASSSQSPRAPSPGKPNGVTKKEIAPQTDKNAFSTTLNDLTNQYSKLFPEIRRKLAPHILKYHKAVSALLESHAEFDKNMKKSFPDNEKRDKTLLAKTLECVEKAFGFISSADEQFAKLIQLKEGLTRLRDMPQAAEQGSSDEQTSSPPPPQEMKINSPPNSPRQADPVTHRATQATIEPEDKGGISSLSSADTSIINQQSFGADAILNINSGVISQCAKYKYHMDDEEIKALDRLLDILRAPFPQRCNLNDWDLATISVVIDEIVKFLPNDTFLKNSSEKIKKIAKFINPTTWKNTLDSVKNTYPELLDWREWEEVKLKAPPITQPNELPNETARLVCGINQCIAGEKGYFKQLPHKHQPAYDQWAATLRGRLATSSLNTLTDYNEFHPNKRDLSHTYNALWYVSQHLPKENTETIKSVEKNIETIKTLIKQANQSDTHAILKLHNDTCRPATLTMSLEDLERESKEKSQLPEVKSPLSQRPLKTSEVLRKDVETTAYHLSTSTDRQQEIDTFFNTYFSLSEEKRKVKFDGSDKRAEAIANLKENAQTEAKRYFDKFKKTDQNILQLATNKLVIEQLLKIKEKIASAPLDTSFKTPDIDRELDNLNRSQDELTKLVYSEFSPRENSVN